MNKIQQNKKINKHLMLSYEDMIDIKDFLETKIACLRNDKVYCQDDKESYNEIQAEIDKYAKIFDVLFGAENYMKDSEEIEWMKL